MNNIFCPLLALVLVGTVGLVGCTSDSSESAPSETIIETTSPAISVEQMKFQQDLIASEMSLEDASAIIEVNGYSWRVGSIDGESQMITMDYQINRLTVSLQDNIVVDASWG